MKKFYCISTIITVLCTLFIACQEINSGNGGNISLSIHEITVPANGGSQIVGIDTDEEWITENNNSWIVLSRTKGSVEEKSCTITITPNTESSKRVAEVAFISVDSSSRDKIQSSRRQAHLTQAIRMIIQTTIQTTTPTIILTTSRRMSQTTSRRMKAPYQLLRQ